MTPDDVVANLETQQRGQALLATLSRFVSKRENVILSRLVADLNGGTLTDSSARDGIVGIAALRNLARDVERETKAAMPAASKEF